MDLGDRDVGDVDTDISVFFDSAAGTAAIVVGTLQSPSRRVNAFWKG